jgi:hypothetical protein
MPLFCNTIIILLLFINELVLVYKLCEINELILQLIIN